MMPIYQALRIWLSVIKKMRHREKIMAGPSEVDKKKIPSSKDDAPDLSEEKKAKKVAFQRLANNKLAPPIGWHEAKNSEVPGTAEAGPASSPLQGVLITTSPPVDFRLPNNNTMNRVPQASKVAAMTPAAERKYPFSLADVRKATEAGHKALKAWFWRRGALKDDPTKVHNIPQMGTAYYYRFGGGRFGIGTNMTELLAMIQKVEGAGSAKLNYKELMRVNKNFLEYLQDRYPNLKFVAKEYPPGPFSETTEGEPKRYTENDPVAYWAKSFDPAFTPGKQTWGLMLGHVIVPLKFFPVKPPEIPDFYTRIVQNGLNLPKDTSLVDTFSNVPASLNPFISEYVRKEKGFKGVLMGDWYDMNAANSISTSISKSMADLVGGENADRSIKPKPFDAAFFMGVMADLNYIRPELAESSGMNRQFWKSFAQKSPNEYKIFNDKLNNTILSTYNKLKTEGDPKKTVAEIEALGFDNKIELITSSVMGTGDNPDPNAYNKLKTSFPDKALFDVINDRNKVVANDGWNRMGVATMAKRVATINTLYGTHFLLPPVDIDKELSWLEDMKVNKKFQKAYGAVFKDKTLTKDPAWMDALGLDVEE
jgi:hypothetical protein